MRGLVLVGVLGLAACDEVFGLERDGTPAADAAVDVAGPTDALQYPTDGGITPGTCWTSDNSVEKHDEDGDLIDDPCDNCPGRFNGDQKDADFDGVGDPCDPHPMWAIERIAWFEGFNAMPAGKAIGGSWAHNGASGLLQAEQGPMTLFVLETPLFREPTIDIQFANSIAGVNTEWQLGGMALEDPASAIDARPDGLRCSEVIHTTATDDVFLDRLRAGASDTSARGMVAMGMSPHLARIQYDLAIGDPTCTISRTAGGTGTASLPRTPRDPARVGVGLLTRLTGVTFQSVTVYETIWPKE